jgi:hypothetical protein
LVVVDTLLYAGAALALASALPRDADRVANTHIEGAQKN